MIGLLYKAYPDGCQQVLLRLRPYSMRGHRLLQDNCVCLVLLHLHKQLLLMYHMYRHCAQQMECNLSCDSCCQRIAHCMLSQLDHDEVYIEAADHLALLAC